MIAVSIALGVAWNVAVVKLMGGRLVEAFAAGWLLAGAIAGVTAGLFTIWSRRKRDGKESFLYGIATYYFAVVVYWISFVLIQRVIMCARHGGWTDFDLRDHLALIGILLFYGTFGFGLVLIPFCFLSRYLVWKIYIRSEGRLEAANP
ncbi:MAG TPA: hypothetical protein VM680_12585 [Verrucomicrobiae bacterium]|nr:hypothetical protein [Verrucomicrobiae bacterium]